MSWPKWVKDPYLVEVLFNKENSSSKYSFIHNTTGSSVVMVTSVSLYTRWRYLSQLNWWRKKKVVLYSKPCLKRPLKRRPKIGLHDPLSLNAGREYCRMLSWSILQYIRPTFSYHFLSIFEWPLKTDFTMHGASIKSIHVLLNLSKEFRKKHNISMLCRVSY